MILDEMLGDIEHCATIQSLMDQLQNIIENHGFESFSFIDIGQPDIDEPFSVSTHKKVWDRTYRDHGFVHADPILPVARRTNRPFYWGDVQLPARKKSRTPLELKTMDAARDHGYTEGLVIPIHFTDKVGRISSASAGLFWSESEQDFYAQLAISKHILHVVMLYWAQKISDLAVQELGRRRRFAYEEGQPVIKNMLTNRERDVLSWAARGKTMSETGIILGISDATVETHFKNILSKLNADNKTHAVAKAIYLGLIDV